MSGDEGGSFFRRPGVLGSTIVLGAAIVLTLLTVLRFRGRESAPIDEAHAQPQHEIYQVRWDRLPKIDDFELTERAGTPWRTADVQGKVWVVSFFFSRCPSVCKRQNEAIRGLQSRLKDRDVTFVSITCDPAYDSPAILSAYANKYEADPERWKFLTGPIDRIKEIGTGNFHISVGPETHATSLMVIDRWGRYRDRIDWEQTKELDRLFEVVDTCLAESSPPGEIEVETRVPYTDGGDPAELEHGATHAEPARTVITPQAVAELIGDSWKSKEWTDRFDLVDRHGRLFRSESMAGKVWVTSFFFTRCPSICKRMNERVASLHQSLAGKGIEFVSITSDSAHDVPVKLDAYARGLGLADDDDTWKFLVGEPLQTRRVASEFFTAFADGEAHDEHLILMDKWGRVRGKYRFDDDAAIVELRLAIDRLSAETEPPDLTPPLPPSPDDEGDESPDATEADGSDDGESGTGETTAGDDGRDSADRSSASESDGNGANR